MAVSDNPLHDVAGAVTHVRRSAAVGYIVTDGIRGLIVGTAIAAGLAAIDHAISFGPSTPLVFVIVLAGIAGACWGFRRRPDDSRAARVLDHHFDLADRSTTALDLKHSEEPIAELQREDAARSLQDLKVRTVRRRFFRPGEALALPFAIAVFLALALTLPSASAKPIHSSHQTDLTRIHKVLHHQLPPILKSIQKLAENNPLNPTVVHMYHELKLLRKSLSTAHTRAQALRSLSLAQQQLHHLVSGMHPISHASATHLLHSLQSTPGAGVHATSSRNATAQAAKALKHLAAAISHMSQSQRSALARSLARTANNSSSSSQLQSSLRQAASSLAYHDSKTAASSLQQAAAALAKSASQQSALSRAAATSNQLQRLKGAVSGLSQSGTPTGLGGPGRGKGGKGSGGRGSGRGQGSGSTHGSKGSGRTTGSGSGRGSGSTSGSRGSGAGRGGAGARGSGGGRGNRGGSRSGGPGTHVYVPGRNGTGPHSILRGPNGQPLPGFSVPYREVLVRYEQSVRSALEEGTLPPSLENYVRRYFSRISR